MYMSMILSMGAYICVSGKRQAQYKGLIHDHCGDKKEPSLVMHMCERE